MRRRRLRRHRILAWAAVAGAAFAGAAAQAQTSAIFVDRDRLDEPPLPQPNAPPIADARPAPALTAAPHETLQAIHVAGDDDAASVAAIARLAAPFKNRPITRETLAALVSAIEGHYARRGLALHRVLIPPQKFEGGRVRVVALRGRIADVTIAGAPPKQAAAAQRIAARLLKDSPLHTARLQRALLLINQTPGLSVAATFAPVEGEPSAVRLHLKAKARRFAYGASVNNEGQALLGRTQFELTGLANSLVLAGDQGQIFYGFPEAFERYRFIALTYAAPLGADGWRAHIGASHLKTAPEGLAVSGEAQTLSLRTSYPLHLTPTRAIYVFAALDTLQSENALLGQTISTDRTRVMRTTLSHTRAGDRGVTSIGATLSFGLDAWDAQTTAPFGDPRFAKIDVRLARDHALDAKTTIRLAATAQFSSEDLPSSERFQFGGRTIGRGFAPASHSADRALAGSIQAARALTPADAPFSLSINAFVDGARLYKDRYLTMRDSVFSSAGAGAEIGIGPKAALSLLLARPIAGDGDQAGGGEGGTRFLLTMRTAL